MGKLPPRSRIWNRSAKLSAAAIDSIPVERLIKKVNELCATHIPSIALL
jgi:hypothetical protein